MRKTTGVDINRWNLMGCPHCDTKYLPVRSPRNRCICRNRYFYDVQYVLEDIHSGDLREGGSGRGRVRLQPGSTKVWRAEISIEDQGRSP